MDRIVIALTMANGARIRPVCRTGDCTWRGCAWENRWSAERERADHRLDHLTSQTRPYTEVWDDSCAPGGYVCDRCGMPVESEPCPEHAPAEAVNA
ncbi:hypothetical protein [Planobispora rosea]|uniref:hypothetical protein n=1 Tax=Planobispora rosea TaxID=35762 RepID=UPI00083AE988|nr:hypothetical protein [Planobispora rosea]